MKKKVLSFHEAYPGSINDLDAYIKVELSRRFKTVAGRSYRGISTMHSSSPASVSYTHLDVYKRQVYYSERGKKRGIKKFLDESKACEHFLKQISRM